MQFQRELKYDVFFFLYNYRFLCSKFTHCYITVCLLFAENLLYRYVKLIMFVHCIHGLVKLQKRLLNNQCNTAEKL